MALKDIWTNKTDDVDVILADNINAIANEVISNTENKADRSELPTKVSQLENDKNYVTPEEIQPIYQDINYLDTQTRNLEAKKADKLDTYTATETDDMLSTKADKADLDSINSIINKNFELIATQTVSPDTDGSLPNAIEFSVDNELTDFYLYVNAKITATSAVRLHTNDVSLWGNATIPGLYNANSTLYYHWYIQYLSFGENKGGIISAPSQAIANSSGIVRPPQGNLYNDYSVIVPHTSVHDKVSAINNIKKIKLSLVNTANNPAFAEGSTFELWGVKKK